MYLQDIRNFPIFYGKLGRDYSYKCEIIYNMREIYVVAEETKD